jgi:hypothetical protein
VGKSFFIWHFLMPKWRKKTKKQKGAKAPFVGTSVHNETSPSCDKQKNSSDDTRYLGAGTADGAGNRT